MQSAQGYARLEFVEVHARRLQISHLSYWCHCFPTCGGSTECSPTFVDYVSTPLTWGSGQTIGSAVMKFARPGSSSSCQSIGLTASTFPPYHRHHRGRNCLRSSPHTSSHQSNSDSPWWSLSTATTFRAQEYLIVNELIYRWCDPGLVFGLSQYLAVKDLQTKFSRVR